MLLAGRGLDLLLLLLGLLLGLLLWCRRLLLLLLLHGACWVAGLRHVVWQLVHADCVVVLAVVAAKGHQHVVLRRVPVAGMLVTDKDPSGVECSGGSGV